MSELRERLRQGPALLLDGGLGTMLIARGLAPGQPPERWLLERPSDVTAVHRACVEAGSEAVHANTFGANPVRLAAFGLAPRCAELNERAVALARQSQARFVIADVGPTGEYLPPVGKGHTDGWYEAFLCQGRALRDTGVDALHVETMSDVREALTALRALREAAPGLPVLVSLTFERKKRGFFTVMGNALGQALVTLAEAGADAVGANCSITSADMGELAQLALGALRELGHDVPLVAQPNAGQPRTSAAGLSYDQLPTAFAADMAAVARAGARAVGGCCGTDPRFIAELRARLDVGGS